MNTRTAPGALYGRLRAAGAAGVLAATLIACVPPGPPQAVVSNSYELAGYYPRGPYVVTVDAALASLVPDVEYTLSRLRAITGIDIRYVGTPSGWLGANEFRVQAGESCIYSGIACEQPYVLGDVVANGTVTITPYARYYNLRTVILHEFGHLFGLNHWSGAPVQVMNADAEDLGDYQAGDQAGLRAAVGR